MVSGLTFGWGQPGEGVHTRVPPKLKTVRISPNVFERVPYSLIKIKDKKAK